MAIHVIPLDNETIDQATTWAADNMDAERFDQLSDLDGKNTTEKASMVPDGNAVGDILTEMSRLAQNSGYKLGGFVLLDSESELPANPADKTIGYLIDGDLYLWVGTGGDTADGKYQNCGTIRGTDGQDGQDGSPGAQGPKGDKGDPGTYINPANVEIFQALSDLVGKTTSEKEAMIASGNVIFDNEVLSNLLTATNIYVNLMLDTGEISTNQATANNYKCREFAISPTKKYIVRSKVRGSGYHQIYFKNAGGSLIGNLNEVTQEKYIETLLDSTNIPSGTSKMYVNGYVLNGDQITAKETDYVVELAKQVPSLVSRVNNIVRGSVTIDLSLYQSYAAYIGTDNKYASIVNAYCKFYPVVESGTYKIIAQNGLAGYTVVTSNNATIGTSAQYAPGYSSVINMTQGQEDTITLTSGVYIYMRADTDPDGRVLPVLKKIGEDAIVYHSEMPSLMAKEMNCLFIGNSVSQDHVSYLPWLLKNTYGDDVKFRICIAYKASYTIAKYVTDIITGNVNLDIFSVADNVQGWTNTNNYPWANIWTNYGHFDLICFEGYFNHASTSAGYVEDPTSFKAFIDDLKTRQTDPFKLGYLMHQTYTTTTHTETDAWARIVGGAEYAIQNNPVSILFPCGVVTKLVNGDISQSFLTNDNTHNQQGLPCIMGGYVLMEELARYFGLPSKILNNHLRIDSTTETALNIPGPNGSLQVGTDAQYAICQDAAVKAVKYGDKLIIDNSVLS